MEFWRSDPDEPPAPFPPPPPPQLWLQQPPPPPPPPSQPQSSYCDFTEQRTTRVGCRNSGFGLDNDYLNNVEYTGQGIGRRTTENFPNFDNIHKEVQRDIDLEKETRKTGCTNSGFGSRQNVAHFGQGTGRANGNVDMLYNVNPETQRDVEKEKIREEIIAAEMARRRELEAEVREELRIERELALRMKGGNAFDEVRVPMDPRGKSLMQEAKGLSLEEKLATHAAKLQIQGRTETNEMDLLPSHRTSLKVNETHQEKAKALVSAKRGAYTMFGVWGVGNIAGKIDWRCFICQVSATSEADLKQHFNGNKHKSKRAALKAEKSATTTELQVGGKAVHISRSEPTPSPIVSAKYLVGNGSRSPSITGLGAHSKLQVGGKAVHVSRIEPSLPKPSAHVASKPLDGNTASMLPEKNKAKGSEKFAFWCAMCNVGANNENVMEAHKKGKKHLNQLQKKFAFWCDICKVGAHQANIMEAHMKGKKHLSVLREKTGKAN